ncbi:MAG: phosphate ABC transporter substrate-binding protein [Magnetococcales bacterium]|nr:phosphate ABC transporter substrate-binding protein [Magnetococcales bacterium]
MTGWRSLLFSGLVGVLVFQSPSAHAFSDPNVQVLRNKGSDTMIKAVRAWAEGFGEVDSSVLLEVYGGGSGNGIAALINGHVEIANSSRPMKPKEARLVRKRSRKPPMGLVVGLDAVGIVVHKNNPLNGISVSQLREIFDKKGSFTSWADLEVSVPGCQGQEIKRISRKNNSGTYSFFKHSILGKRRHFHPERYTVGSASAVIKEVSSTPCAIGYSGMAYVTGDQLKTLCLATDQGPCIPPTAQSIRNKTYPLARPLYMYTLGEPEGVLKSFLMWVVGTEGQARLKAEGYVTINP